MKEYTVKLTAKDIDILQICLCEERLILEKQVDHLSNHNLTGINTAAINKKRNCMEECDRLFALLLNAEDGIEV